MTRRIANSESDGFDGARSLVLTPVIMCPSRLAALWLQLHLARRTLDGV
jgi:hypothetical protein